MEEDQISYLPETILHDILSRLPEEDVARTSVLSKKWEKIWSTYPILSFSDTKMIEKFSQSMEDNLVERKNKFVDYVNRRLLRFHNQGLLIKEFKLSINRFEPQHISEDVDHWVKLASESGVGLLELCLHDDTELDDEENQCYILPTGVIEAKSLYKLELMGAIRVDQAFLNHSVKFFTLRELSLWYVLSADEHAIQHLISSCPFLEDITLRSCSVSNRVDTSDLHESRTYWMEKISMVGLQKLKKVDVEGIREVVVDSQSLQYFSFSTGEDMDSPFKMSFEKCINLIEIELWSLNITTIADKWLSDLQKFAFLDILNFSNCVMPETLTISSANLKFLGLSKCSNLKEITVDAPNLLSCGYDGYDGSRPIISFLRCSIHLEVDAFVQIESVDPGTLREIIQNFKPQNVLTSLCLFIRNPIVDGSNLAILPDSSTPPSIKHLDLRFLPKNETSYLPLVNVLLSSCCPETISMTGNSLRCSRAFVECLYETLMRGKEAECFCSSSDAKCWWHAVKNVKVSSCMRTNENIDLKTLLDTLPISLHGKSITFRLEM